MLDFLPIWSASASSAESKYFPQARTVVIPSPERPQLESLLARFTGERFWVRAGGPGIAGDPELEGKLASRGVDGYDATYKGYLFCAVCDFDSGFLTILSDRLWASEVMRRARPAVAELRWKWRARPEAGTQCPSC